MSHSTDLVFRNVLRRLSALTLAFVVLAGVGLVGQNVFPPSTGAGGGTTLPTQSGQAGKFLKTDGSVLSWDAVNSAVWGNITGPLASQTDLDTALNARLAKAAFVAPVTFEAGVCQGASPAMAFSFKTGTGATALCADEGGANGAVTGVAAFDAVGEQVQGRFTLPNDYAPGTVRLDVYYRAVPTSGDVTWRLDNAVVLDGTTSGTIDFSSGNQNTAAASTVQGTTLRRSTVTVSSVTTTGWAANAQVYWRLVLSTWTGTALSTSNTIQVIAVRFTIPRA